MLFHLERHVHGRSILTDLAGFDVCGLPDDVDARDVPQGPGGLLHDLLDGVVPALCGGAHQFDNLDDSHF